MILISSESNTRSLGLVDPEKIRIVSSNIEHLEFRKTLTKREHEGKFYWGTVPYPCNALAQEAGMGLFAYKEFIKEALCLNEDDPVKYWKNVEKEQQKIVDNLNIPLSALHP